MTNRPTTIPTWATDDTQILTGNPTKVEPPAALMAEGWIPKQKPPAEMLNHWMNLVSRWIDKLQEIPQLNNWGANEQTSAGMVAAGVICKEFVNEANAWVVYGASGGVAQASVKSSARGAWASHGSAGGVTAPFTAGIARKRGDTLYLLGTSNGQIARSVDVSSNLNWNPIIVPLLAGYSIDGFAHDPTNDIFAAFTDDATGISSASRSTDGGLTWDSPINSGVASKINVMSWHASSSEFIAITDAGHVLASPDMLAWTLRLTDPALGGLSMLASKPGLLMAGRDASVFTSIDNGLSWIPIAIIGEDGTAISSAKGELIYIEELDLFAVTGGGDQLWTSKDGQVWQTHIVGGSDTKMTGICFGYRSLMMVGGDESYLMARLGGAHTALP